MNLQKITIFFSSVWASFFSIVKICFLSKFRSSLKKYKIEPDECCILGNGPCLSKDLEYNLNFIKSRAKISVNHFAFSEEYERIKPDYYILAAPEFWLKDTTDYHKEMRIKLANNLVDKTNWQMKLFIPFSAKNSEFCNIVLQNKNITIVHFNVTPIEGLTFISKILFNLNLGMPRPHNVLIPSIFLSINLGFKKIYIFGADHSWHEEIKIGQDNKVTVNHQHFYDKSEQRMPMYKLDGKEYYIHDIFRKLHLAFKGYFTLRNYAESQNAVILNASSKSYIDAFQKVKLNG